MMTATVTHYDRVKKFGFMKPLNSDIVRYFELRFQVAFIFDGEEKPAILKLDERALLEPEKGSIVYLESEDATRGPRAKWWGFKQEYDEAQEACDQRPTFRLRQRVGRIPKSRLQANSEPCRYQTLLESRNISEFHKYMKSMAQNPHDREWSAIWFEWLNNGKWEQCEDPRNGNYNPTRNVQASV